MHFKLSYLNSNFVLTLGYVKPALNNPALERNSDKGSCIIILVNKQAIQVISTFQQSSIWACQYYYSYEVVVIFFLGWYAYRDQETALKQLCQVSDHTVNNALNCPCPDAKIVYYETGILFTFLLRARWPLRPQHLLSNFVRHSFSHCVIIYKIFKIVCALWLAERSICRRVCKHGCDLKMFCFSRTNHASTNLKKFLSRKLDEFTLFTHSLVGWNLENLYKQMRI